MSIALSRFDRDLLDRWQRDLPLVPRPFAVMAESLGSDEATVISRLRELCAAGAVARVGATCRPNTLGASTLAALSVPDWEIERIAEIVSEEPGVNHSYLREHDWNLWFVATAADLADLGALLDRIGTRTGLEVLNLPLVRPYNIDLGFSLHGEAREMPQRREADLSILDESDRPLMQALSAGLPLEPCAFSVLAEALGRTEMEVIDRVSELSEAGILTRVGVIVRHRTLGWRSNAMVAWDLPEHRIDAAGLALAAYPGITLSYRRRTVPGRWPYALFSMIHGKSRADALGVLTAAAALPELAGASYQVLFSLRCFKQTGARLVREKVA